ncbi:MAG: long-chain fatty acid--CoA ligase, partial [Candidatus Thermoplasmatota archaeon]|nr:long-chain fatty acid--CoA ligase [Candidatus Thermoplasmatota archaeon]
MPKKVWFKNWNENITKTLEYPEISVDKIFQKAAEWYPRKPFMIFYGNRIDYGSSWKHILGLSASLKSLGIKKG